jgi:IPT/TIG domain
MGSTSVQFTSGTTFTVPQNYFNSGPNTVIWIWFGGGGGHNATSLWDGTAGFAGAGGNGGNIFLIDSFALGPPGGQYGIGVGSAVGPGGGSQPSSFGQFPNSGSNGAFGGGAGGAGGENITGGGGGAANPGGGGSSGGSVGVLSGPAGGGAAGPGESPWPSNGGAGGNSGAFGDSGSGGNNFGGGGGGANVNPSDFPTGGNGAQGIVFLFYNTISLATITSASPNPALQNNGTEITLGGTGFTTVTNVELEDTVTGTLYTCSFDIGSDTVLDIAPPALPQEFSYNPHLFITNQVGQQSFENIYTLEPNAPICSSLSTQSFDNGQQQVDLNGQFFTTLTLVEVVDVGELTQVSPPPTSPEPGTWWFGDDTIIGMFPPAISPQAATAFTLSVENSSGSAQITIDYIPSPPTFNGISATEGDESGGYSVVITGSGFTTTTDVFFGSAPCPSFTVNSDTSITVVVPPFNGVSQGGTVNVTLSNPTASVAGFNFTYTFSGYPALNAAHGFV